MSKEISVREGMSKSTSSLELAEQTKAVRAFLEKLFPATGDLILIPGKRSRLNEPLYISVRHGFEKQSSSKNSLKNSKLEPTDQEEYLVMDFIADRKGEKVLIGVRGWTITKEDNVYKDLSPSELEYSIVADGNFNRRFLVPDIDIREIDSLDNNLNSNAGLKVTDQTFSDLLKTEPTSYTEYLVKKGLISSLNTKDRKKPIYRRYGIAAFMTAVSFFLLQKKGVQKIISTEASFSAKSVWNKFGRVSSRGRSSTGFWGNDRGEKWFTNEVSLKKLIQHPNVTKILEDFILK